MRLVAVLLLVAATAHADPALPGIDDLPKLVLARPTQAKVTQSEQLNNAGYKLHVAKKYVEAAGKYKAAVVADPGNLLARYNLASVFVSAGKADVGVGILKAFALADCRACLGILLHSTADGEWKPARDAADYKALVKDLKVDAIDLPARASDVADLVDVGNEKKKSARSLAAYIHPRLPVHVIIDKGEKFRLETTDELERWAIKATAEKEPLMVTGARKKCTATCCTFGSAGSKSDIADELDEVCFTGVGGVLFLDTIKLSSYLGSAIHP